MKKLIIASAVVALLMLTAYGSFVLGARSRTPYIGAQLASVQAALGFNHLLRYREIEADLSKGCSSEALEKTRISIDQEMHLLASFYAEDNDTGLNKYISDRDPLLLDQLKNFKSKYGASWKEPQCAK